MTVDVCPACGYPTIGPELCSFCRPVRALAGDEPFEPMLFRDAAAPFFHDTAAPQIGGIGIRHPSADPAAHAGEAAPAV